MDNTELLGKDLQNSDHYIIGCNLYRNKLLRRMEVMYDGRCFYVTTMQ